VLTAVRLAGLVALALWVLLLLAGFLAAALLLPGALLAGVLSLLARILVLLLRHLGETPLLDVERRQRPAAILVAMRNPVPRKCGTGT
jgi:fatty acid desaturase